MNGNRVAGPVRLTAMRRLALAPILTLALLGACAGGPQSGVDSGVQGTVLVGPSCPVQQVGSPCPGAPFDGSVQASRDGNVIATVQVDPDGAYRIPLAPGTYVVQPVLIGGGVSSTSPVTVLVHAGSFASVDLTVDSGIR